MTQATVPLSMILFFQGLAAALAGTWQMKVGIRCSMLVATSFLGGGILIGSIGVATHNIWLLYLGYGFFSGCGMGLAYTPPLQALIEWFPDKKGMIGGIAIGGVGSGAILFTPISQYLLKKFEKIPEYAGAIGSISTITKDGRLFTENNGYLREVIIAHASDLAKVSDSLKEGLYYVGTGNTGAAMTLAIFGASYLALMLTASLTIRRPPIGYKPEGYIPISNSSITNGNVHVNNVMKTPQFFLLGTTMCFILTGGMAVFSVAKSMMIEVFGTCLPGTVTAAYASSFVLLLAVANLFGRLFWGVVSDKIGRRNTFFIFTLGSIPLYLALPSLVATVVSQHSFLHLYGFMASTVLSISIMGGCYAIMPAYEADLFGSKYIGPIHGKFFLASSAGALLGPPFVLSLRHRAEVYAIADLLKKADPEKFQAMFGVDISQAQTLIDAKTVTISKLMKLVPENVADPTPFLYDSTMYTMAGLMSLAAISHYYIKPVEKKYFEVIPIENQGNEEKNKKI